MPTISELTGGSVPLRLRLESGGIIKANYFPKRISGADLKSMLRVASALDLSKTDQQNDAVAAVLQATQDAAHFVVKVVEKWDLLEDDGTTPVPVTQERVEDFGIEFLFELMSVLIGAVRLGEPKRIPSPTRSSRSRTSHSKGSSSPLAVVSHLSLPRYKWADI